VTGLRFAGHHRAGFMTGSAIAVDGGYLAG
jgi:hypothetical protein